MENKSQGSNDVAVDVHRDIQEMLYTAGRPLTEKCCIYKVPHRLCKLNEDAYTPKVVSIGPFHYGSSHLRNAERQKQIFFRKFIERSDTDLDSLISYVEGLESEVRDYYSENITPKEGELVKIILVDAGFIIELFIWYALKDWNKDEILSLNSWLFPDVQQDLLLLENQLPFSVLHDIFRFARLKILRSLLELTFNMFRSFNLQNIGHEVVAYHGLLHFTDLLRTFYLQPKPACCCDRQQEPVELLYSVNKLHEAGVQLKANKRSQRLLDLKFSGGVLEIPPLIVDDNTEKLFRNMLALEQCHYSSESYITDYVMILDYLIDKERDVDVLVRKGIVKSWLGENNEVVKLVNGLGQNIYHGSLNSDYHLLCNNLNAFGKRSWRITKATFRRRYCNTPWQTAASIAASLILIFTLTQTLCSLYQVIHGD